ncbi:MAG: cupin domain-containing protein [Chloroflexota bacterium]|nr:cupin domain-containing protein [Chloroflexota bacterium]
MVASKGIIARLGDQEARTGIMGHPNVVARRLLEVGEEGSLHLNIACDVIAPGGGIEAHYHDNAAPFDHAYYVIRGRILAKVGDREERVGANTLIYCPSNVVHSIENVGKGDAWVLRIVAAKGENTGGKSVFVK